MANFIHCALCNSNDTWVICKKAGLKRGEAKKVTNVICRKCRLIYNNPMPADEELEEYYLGQYAEDRGITEGGYEIAIERIRNKQPEIKNKKIVEFIKNFIKENDSVLDIGCSYGILLAEIKKQINCQVKGIEPGAMFSKVAREYYGLSNIEQKFFNNYIKENKGREQFDFIILRHVFEHFREPNQVIMDLKSIIKPNGYLFLVVPNAASFKPLKPLEQNLEFGHVYSYTPFSLQRLLLKHKLKIVKWSFDYVFSLQVIATRMENPIKAIDAGELKQGQNIRLLYYKLINHNCIRNLLRIKRKIKCLFNGS